MTQLPPKSKGSNQRLGAWMPGRLEHPQNHHTGGSSIGLSPWRVRLISSICVNKLHLKPQNSTAITGQVLMEPSDKISFFCLPYNVHDQDWVPP